VIPFQNPCDDVIPDPDPAPAALCLRLCNFKTGDAELLDNHTEALDQEILKPHWRSQDGKIHIVGYASKLKYAHSPEGNQMLSEDRCNSVMEYLEPHMPAGFEIKVVDPEGDSESQDDPTGNAGFYRAVLVKLFAKGYTKVYPKEPHPIPRHHLEPPSNLFMFVPVKITSGGPSLDVVGLQWDSLLFKLVDVNTGQSRYFTYSNTLSPPGFSAGKSSFISSGWESPDRPIISTKVSFKDFVDFTTIGDPTNATLSQGSIGVSNPAGVTTSVSGMELMFRPRGYISRGFSDWITVRFSFSKGKGGGAAASNSNGSITVHPEDYDPGL
jgi:hypothetical protein